MRAIKIATLGAGILADGIDPLRNVNGLAALYPCNRSHVYFQGNQMGICGSTPIPPSQVIRTEQHISTRDGSGHFALTMDGKFHVDYELRDKSLHQHDPRAQQKLAKIERKFFLECCQNPGLDYKPRENLRKHFCLYNSAIDHGALPPRNTRQMPYWPR